MTPRAFGSLHLMRAKRVRVGALALMLMVMLALFAEWITADAPLLVIRPAGVEVLPAVTHAGRYRGLSRTEMATLHAHAAVVWPLYRWGPNRRDTPYQAASLGHPLGTDAGGRDVFARVIYGSRSALGLALLAPTIGALLGVALGTLAGARGRGWDEVALRPVEVIAAFPSIILVLLLTAAMRSVWALLFAAALLRFAEVTRLTRAEVLRLSRSSFVEAAAALGCRPTRVLFRHVLPHAMLPLTVSCMFGLGSVVILETAAAFLGVGGAHSWGQMIAEGLGEGDPRLAWAAIAALTITMGAAYLITDALVEYQNHRVKTTGSHSA